jgi:hypothetical protein
LVEAGVRYAEYLIGEDDNKLVAYYLLRWRELPK